MSALNQSVAKAKASRRATEAEMHELPAKKPAAKKAAPKKPPAAKKTTKKAAAKKTAGRRPRSA